jgi:hypothetical protein
MRFPQESPGLAPSYEQLKEYVNEVEALAQPLSDGPPGLELVDEELADRWADYLDPQKRMSEDGPFARFLLRRYQSCPKKCVTCMSWMPQQGLDATASYC